jgi:hypothetical protein
VVFQGGPDLVPAVQKVAADKKVSIPLTVLPQGTSAGDFQNYKISPEAENTIILYKGKRVVNNFVNVKHENWADVEKATAAMAGG